MVDYKIMVTMIYYDVYSLNNDSQSKMMYNRQRPLHNKWNRQFRYSSNIAYPHREGTTNCLLSRLSGVIKLIPGAEPGLNIFRLICP